MAGNYMVIGSKFKPFSYAEMLQPVQMADTEHKLLEEGLGELNTKASVWDNLANEQTDPYAYNMYKNYSKELVGHAESLSKEGLTPGSRKALLSMKSRYSSDIVPIEQAYTRRKELSDEQRKLRAQDPTLLYDKDASTLSLDELIKNPNIAPQSYSGSLITKQVASAAQNLAKEMRDNPREWKTTMGGQYFESMMKKGYKSEEILMAAANDPNAPKELKNIVEDAISSSGIKNWGDENTIKRAYEFGNQGLWNAVGETQYQVQSNKAYDYAMQERLARIKKGSDKKTKDTRLHYSAVPRTGVDPTKETTQIESDIDFIKSLEKEVATGSKDSLLGKSTQKYQGRGVSSYGQSYGQFVEAYPNRDRLKSITAKYNTTNPSELINLMQKDIETSAVRNFQYSTNYTDNSLLNKVVISNLSTMATDSSIPAYEYKDGEKKGQLDSSDLKEMKKGDGFVVYDPMGSALTYKYTDEDGKIKTALLDPEVLDDKSRTLKSIQSNIELAKQAKDYDNMSVFIDQYMTYLDGKFNTLAKVQGNTDSKLVPQWGGEEGEEEE